MPDEIKLPLSSNTAETGESESGSRLAEQLSKAFENKSIAFEDYMRLLGEMAESIRVGKYDANTVDQLRKIVGGEQAMLVEQIGNTVSGSAPVVEESTTSKGEQGNDIWQRDWEINGNSMQTTLPDGRVVKVLFDRKGGGVKITEVWQINSGKTTALFVAEKRQAEESAMNYLAKLEKNKEIAKVEDVLDEGQFEGRGWTHLWDESCLFIELDGDRSIRAKLGKGKDGYRVTKIEFTSGKKQVPLSLNDERIVREKVASELLRRQEQGKQPFETSGGDKRQDARPIETAGSENEVAKENPFIGQKWVFYGEFGAKPSLLKVDLEGGKRVEVTVIKNKNVFQLDEVKSYNKDDKEIVLSEAEIVNALASAQADLDRRKNETPPLMPYRGVVAAKTGAHAVPEDTSGQVQENRPEEVAPTPRVSPEVAQAIEEAYGIRKREPTAPEVPPVAPEDAKDWKPNWQPVFGTKEDAAIYCAGPVGIDCEIRARININKKDVVEVIVDGEGVRLNDTLREDISKKAQQDLRTQLEAGKFNDLFPETGEPSAFDKDKFSQGWAEAAKGIKEVGEALGRAYPGEAKHYAPIELHHGLAAEVAERHQDSVWRRAGIEAAIGSTQAPGARGYLDIPRWLWARRNVLGKEGGLGEDIKKMFEEFQTVRDKEAAQGIGEGHLLTKEETDAVLGRLVAHRNRMLERFGDVSPEKRAELADAIDSLLWEFSLRPTADMNERDREINRVIQEHAEIKVNGMQALKAGVDSALLGLGIFTGGTGFLIRGGVGGGFRIALRGQRVAREARSKRGRELAAEREQRKEELWSEIVAKQAKGEDASGLESEFINLHFAGRRRAKIIEGDNWWEQLRQATTDEGRERLQQLIGRRLVYDGVAGTGRGLIGFMETAEQERQFKEERSKEFKESEGKGIKQQLLTSAKFRGRRVLNSASSFGVLLQGGGLIAASIGRKIEHSTQALQVAIDAAHTAPSSQAARGLLGEAYQRVANALIEGTASQEQILAEVSQRGELINPSFWNHAVGFDRTYGRVWRGLNMAKDWLCGIETPGGGVGAGGGVPLPEAGDRSVDVTNDMHLPPNWTAGVTHEGGHSFVHVFDNRGIAQVVVPDAGGLTTEGMIRIADERVAEIQVSTVPSSEAALAPPQQSPEGPSVTQQEETSGGQTRGSGETPDTETRQTGSPPPAPGAGPEAGLGIRSAEGATGKPPEIFWRGKVNKGDNILKLLKDAFEKNAPRLGYMGDLNNVAELRAWAETQSTRQFVADYLWDYGRPGGAHYDAKSEAATLWQRMVGNSEVRSSRELSDFNLISRLKIEEFNDVLRNKASNLVIANDELTLDDKGNIYVKAQNGTERIGHVPDYGPTSRSSVGFLRWHETVGADGKPIDTADVGRGLLYELPRGANAVGYDYDGDGRPDTIVVTDANGRQFRFDSEKSRDGSEISSHFFKTLNAELHDLKEAGLISEMPEGDKRVEPFIVKPIEKLSSPLEVGGSTEDAEPPAPIPTSTPVETPKPSPAPTPTPAPSSDIRESTVTVQEKTLQAAAQVEVTKPTIDVWNEMWERGDKGGKTIDVIKEFHNKFAAALHELPQPSGANDENLIRRGVINYLRLCGDPRSLHYDPEVGELWNKVVSAGIDPTKKEGLIEGMNHLSKSEARYIIDKLIPDFVAGKRSTLGIDLGGGDSPIPYADAKRSPDVNDIASKVSTEVPPTPNLPTGSSSAGVPPAQSRMNIAVGTGVTTVNEPSPVDVVVGTAGDKANEATPPPVDIAQGTAQTIITEVPSLKGVVGTSGEKIEEAASSGIIVSTSGERIAEEPLDVAVGTSKEQVAESAPVVTTQGEEAVELAKNSNTK